MREWNYTSTLVVVWLHMAIAVSSTIVEPVQLEPSPFVVDNTLEE